MHNATEHVCPCVYSPGKHIRCKSTLNKLKPPPAADTHSHTFHLGNVCGTSKWNRSPMPHKCHHIDMSFPDMAPKLDTYKQVNIVSRVFHVSLSDPQEKEECFI